MRVRRRKLGEADANEEGRETKSEAESAKPPQRQGESPAKPHSVRQGQPPFLLQLEVALDPGNMALYRPGNMSRHMPGKFDAASC